MTELRKLLVLGKAEELALLVYKETVNYPKNEAFGLTSQMRWAVVSIPANIIEGRSRFYKKEYLQFLQIALGSLAELEYYFRLSLGLNYLKQENFNFFEVKVTEVGKMLNGLVKSLRNIKEVSKE